MIRKQRVSVTTVGGAGVATGNATLSLGRPGIVRAMAVDWGATAPATSDLTVKADSSSGLVIFSTANTVTDITAKPVAMPGMDETGAATAATDVGSGGFPVSSGIYVQVDQSNALAPAVAVDFWIET